MAEWLKAHDSKSCGPQGLGGSNPSSSATFKAPLLLGGSGTIVDGAPKLPGKTMPEMYRRLARKPRIAVTSAFPLLLTGTGNEPNATDVPIWNGYFVYTLRLPAQDYSSNRYACREAFMKKIATSVVVALCIGVLTAHGQEGLILENGAEVTIEGTTLEASYVVVCSGSAFDYGNRLLIRNGGTVRCLGSMYVNGTVSTGVNYDWLYSYASISGAESTLDIGGDLRLYSSDLSGRTPGTWDPWGVPCHMEISDGATVSVGGTVSIQNASTLNLGSGGTLSVGSDFNASMAGFSYGSGSTLSVAGQLSGLSTLASGRRFEAVDVLGDLTVHGTFAPGNSPGDSVVNGSLTLAADGTLEMEMEGYEPGTEHDRLSVTGPATLEGELDLVFLDEFTVAYGDRFDLFDWDGGVSGEFSSIASAPLSEGLSWDASELYTTGSLSVVPEPGVVGMLAFFGGGLFFARRIFAFG